MDSLGAYFAWGNYEQKTVIFPEKDLVVVFTAYIQDFRVEHWLLRDYILPAIIEECETEDSDSSHLSNIESTNGYSIELFLICFTLFLINKKQRNKKSY